MASDRLDAYRAKRRPNATPEPFPDTGPSEAQGGARFVIHEHHARRLHWDLRLERDGVLACWAIPRGLPPSQEHNHLAVHTEDHPLEYLDFSGHIPAGEYGAGSMMVWDHGTYDIEKFDDREVKIVLNGERGRARYVLFATSGRDWMIRRMQPPADGWQPPPARLEVMRAVEGRLPRTDGWVLEPCWEGVRALVSVDRVDLRVAAGGLDEITAWCRNLRGIVDAFGTTDVVLDGVLTVLHDGTFDGAAARRRLPPQQSEPPRRGRNEQPFTFIAFDVLHFDGAPLLDEAWQARRETLESLDLPQPAFERSPSFPGPLAAVAEALRAQGFDHGIAKRTVSRYRSAVATKDWRRVPLKPSERR